MHSVEMENKLISLHFYRRKLYRKCGINVQHIHLAPVITLVTDYMCKLDIDNLDKISHNPETTRCSLTTVSEIKSPEVLIVAEIQSAQMFVHIKYTTGTFARKLEDGAEQEATSGDNCQMFAHRDIREQDAQRECVS